MTAYTIGKSAFLPHGPKDTGGQMRCARRDRIWGFELMNSLATQTFKSTLLALFRKLLGEYAVLIPDRYADGKAGHQQHCC
jgi:hypothetical protein